MHKLFFFFIDGLGLGKNDLSINPTLRSTPPLFSDLTSGNYLLETDQVLFFENGTLIPTDALLGIAGLPQSATGQTTIFTGINAAAVIGRHLNAFPNPTLIKIIQKKSLMKTLREQGIRVTSANLYSQGFFTKRKNSKRNLFPASTLTIEASGVNFRFPPDYLHDEAIFADITNETLQQEGYGLGVISPEKAAENVSNILKKFDFVFFEYFHTDQYGHKKDENNLIKIFNTLNRFTAHLWKIVDQKTTSILIVSDHGNVEDLTTSTHTLNKVPVLFLCRDQAKVKFFAEQINSLTHIYPCVLQYFQ
jgi:hypothetical protein